MTSKPLQETFDPSNFSDPHLARALIATIEKLADNPVSIMEVCGTHTVSIARLGLKSVLPETVKLLSGPGCPVCVTDNSDIDKVIALSKLPNVCIATFGDMLRVPGSSSSLMKEKARGSDVRVVYSPLDALDLARQNLSKEVVFVGVGFETTAPLIAAAIIRAKKECLANFSVCAIHKTMPHALETLLADAELNIGGLLLPGHVSTVIGLEPYSFIASKYKIPSVVAGFDPLDILQALVMILRQNKEGVARIENAYTRGVASQGNSYAQVLLSEVFQESDVLWRGLGEIPQSGLQIQGRYRFFDALARFNPQVEPTQHNKACSCGEILRGHKLPYNCPLFDKACTPENPLGPCMVSSEGTCAAYYRYYRS